MGEFSGQQLQEGAITLMLPNWGQEIIEISKANHNNFNKSLSTNNKYHHK